MKLLSLLLVPTLFLSAIALAPFAAEPEQKSTLDESLYDQARLWQDAELSRRQGKPDQARSAIDKALAAERSQFGDVSHTRLFLTEQLASVQQLAKDVEAAQDLYRSERHSGPASGKDRHSARQAGSGRDR